MLLMLSLMSAAAPARADWLLIPFAGTGFGGETSLSTIEGGTGSAQTVFGVSGGWLSNQIIGVEADVMFGPSFFEGDSARLVLDGAVTTLSGGVIVAVPLSITRESLRPYLVGGMGMIHARSTDLAGIFVVDRTFAALHVGGGAIGFVSPSTGYRFDLRYVGSLSREEDRLLAGARRSKLSFWRLSIGVVIAIG